MQVCFVSRVCGFPVRVAVSLLFFSVGRFVSGRSFDFVYRVLAALAFLDVNSNTIQYKSYTCAVPNKKVHIYAEVPGWLLARAHLWSDLLVWAAT